MSEPDRWSEARERARAEVQDVFAPAERECAVCGARSLTSGRVCPRCGTPYVSRRTKPIATPRARWVALAVVIVLLVIVGGLIVLISPGVNRAKRAQASAGHLRSEQLAAAARERVTAEQRPHTALARTRDPGRVAPAPTRLRDRSALIGQLQQAIAADARARVQAGSLTGPVLYVQCSPYPPRSTAAASTLSRRIGPYSCLAVNGTARNSAGAIIQLGDPFWARVDFTTGEMVWCKINPSPGEQEIGQALVTVPLAPACDLARPLPGPLRAPA